jgi:hypothetical protein
MSFLSAITTYSQVGIGISTPHPSGLLDLNDSNKGLLLPRIALTSTSDITTVSNPVKGLLVYATQNSRTGVTAIMKPFKHNRRLQNRQIESVLGRNIEDLLLKRINLNFNILLMKKNLLLTTMIVGISTSIIYAQTGNVGIGTPSPTNKLTVKGNSSVGSGYTGISAPVDGAIIEGNVGVGTANPLSKLEVNGQTKMNDGSVTPSFPPANGSLLQLESTNKGLRMSQIALSTTSTWSPLQGLGTDPSSQGMSVYNTNNAIASSSTAYPANGVGEYFWDGTGWVSTGNAGAQNAEVLFSVTRSGYQSATALAWIVIDFTTKAYDKNNNFNLTTNTFTVPPKGAGFYQINGYFQTTSQVNGQGGYLGLFVNNTFKRYITIGNAAGGAGIAASGTIAVPLLATDIVSIRYQGNSADQDVTAQVDMYQLSR